MIFLNCFSGATQVKQARFLHFQVLEFSGSSIIYQFVNVNLTLLPFNTALTLNLDKAEKQAQFTLSEWK